MTRPGKYSLLLLFIAMAGAIAFSDEITPERMTAAAESLQQIEQTYTKQSAPGRLSFLCLGRFADAEQKEAFCPLMEETAVKLEGILAEQEDWKERMEDYTGADWEELYGQTRLWSMCSRTVLRGRYLLSTVHFWQALCGGGERLKKMTEVLRECQQEEAKWGGQEQILQVLTLWQRGEPSDGDALRVLLHQMMVRSDLTPAGRDQMLLLQKRFELFSEGPFAEELSELFGQKLDEGKDFEWALEYAFLEFGHQREQPLQQVTATWPQAKGFVSRLLLEAGMDRFARQGQETIRQWSPFVLSRMCEAVLESKHPETCRPLISVLSRMYEQPLVMLAMAEVLAGTQPDQAMEYTLKAVRLRQASRDDMVMAASAIAERAARLGCRLYREDSSRYGGAALKALDMYFDLAGEKADPEIQYTAAVIFAEQGQEETSQKLLDLLERSHGEYAVRARMDVFRIRGERAKERQERAALEADWRVWIQSLDPTVGGIAALRVQAATEYAQFLFAEPTRENAEKIAAFLEGEVPAGNAGPTYLYVQALVLLERYGQAVRALSGVEMDCGETGLDLYVLESFLDRLEEYAASGSVEEQALKEAEKLRGCFATAGADKDRADLIWAELAARRAPAGQTGLEAIDEIVGRFGDSTRLEVIRCRAFRRMQQGRWTEAARDWQTVRSAYEPQDKTARDRDWHWWRAKYYELLCYSKLPQEPKEDIAHAVEILRVLYNPAPACWEERLKGLEKGKK